MLRISAGRMKGRKLLPIPDQARDVRPSGARVREAIFDRLQGEVIEARTLDLFAGSGALAIEALSRGASAATVVERDPALVRRLFAQRDALALGGALTVVDREALTWLRDPLQRARRGPFDLVFLDPPYAAAAELCGGALALLAEGWLAPDADVVVEYGRHGGHSPVIARPEGYVLLAARVYGESSVDFLRWQAATG